MDALEIIPQPDHTETELAKFDHVEVAIAEIKSQAEAITVIDHTDKAGATKARNLRLTIKPQRIQADKLRKELKADGLKFLDAIEKKAQTVIKPLEAIEADLKAKEEIVSKHAEREAEKERQRIAAEQEKARKQLEADQAKLAADRAEVERQRAEMEKEKADAEAKRQHEADIAAAVELGRQRAITEQAKATVKWAKDLHPVSQAASVQNTTEPEHVTIKAVYEASSDHLRDMGNASFLTGDALERFTSANQITVELTVRRSTGAVVGVHTSSASIL